MNTIKRIKKKPPTFDKIRNEKGEITDNVEEILEEKKKYLKKLYSKPMQTDKESKEEEILTTIQELFTKGNDHDYNRRIDSQEIEESIKGSKKGAPGPDKITNMMLKNSIEILKNPLSFVINDMKESKEDFHTSWGLGI